MPVCDSTVLHDTVQDYESEVRMMIKHTIISIVIYISIFGIAFADTIAVSSFTKESLAGWLSESFQGNTD